MRQKISDNLLGFKLIILRSELNVETDRSKISSDKSAYFFANTPFKTDIIHTFGGKENKGLRYDP